MNYPQYIKSGARWFLGVIFPVRCILCNNLSRNLDYICQKCLKTISIKKEFECIGCRRYIDFGRTCRHCLKDYCLENLFIICDYKDISVQKMIKVYKYRFISDISKPLLSLIIKYFRWLNEKRHLDILKSSPLLIPVPLAKYRFNWRGFNQAELLCNELSVNTGLRVVGDLLTRGESRPQADLANREERMTNLAGKFRFVGNNLNGRDVLLIDDVCTTGTTLNECAKILKSNGAGKIMALVIARG